MDSHIRVDYTVSIDTPKNYLSQEDLSPILDIFKTYATKDTNPGVIIYENYWENFGDRQTLMLTNCPKENSDLIKEISKAYSKIIEEHFYEGQNFTDDPELRSKIPTLEINIKRHGI